MAALFEGRRESEDETQRHVRGLVSVGETETGSSAPFCFEYSKRHPPGETADEPQSPCLDPALGAFRLAAIWSRASVTPGQVSSRLLAGATECTRPSGERCPSQANRNSSSSNSTVA